MIGILSALSFEARPLTTRGYLVTVTGVGAERAAIAARRLVDNGATALLSWGVAGGLSPQLLPGQLIIPDQVIDKQNNIFLTDPYLKKQIRQTLHHYSPISHNAMLQTDQLITCAKAKQALFNQYQAGALDMESAAIAAIANQAKIPFVVVRAIVDSADMSLPHWLPHIVHTDPFLHSLKFIWKLAIHLETWPLLVDLARSYMLAKKTLNLTANMIDFTPRVDWEEFEVGVRENKVEQV